MSILDKKLCWVCKIRAHGVLTPVQDKPHNCSDKK